MTEEDWLTFTPIEGYRAIPLIHNNPQWHAIDIFDGFGAHLCKHEYLQIRLNANIIRIEE